MKSEKTYLVGTMTTYKETEMDNNTKLLGVRFKPGAISAFFKFVSLNEITNRTIELGKSLRLDLRKVKSPFELLNQQLAGNLNKPNLSLLMQIQTIKKSKGQIKIQELASIHCTTARQLERNFKEHLGITPKEFINLVRYQNAMKAIEKRKSNESILSIAFDFGYYDHSHLTNDFKRYIGCAPTFI
jgi:AraC-like DNA-binding protein